MFFDKIIGLFISEGDIGSPISMKTKVPDCGRKEGMSLLWDTFICHVSGSSGAGVPFTWEIMVSD